MLHNGCIVKYSKTLLKWCHFISRLHPLSQNYLHWRSHAGMLQIKYNVLLAQYVNNMSKVVLEIMRKAVCFQYFLQWKRELTIAKFFCLACSAKFPSWFRPLSGLYHVNWMIATQRARQHFCRWCKGQTKLNSLSFLPKICITLLRQILSCFQLPFLTVIFLIWPLTPSDVATPLYYPLNIAPLWSFIYLIILFIFRVKIEATGQSMPHNLFST